MVVYENEPTPLSKSFVFLQMFTLCVHENRLWSGKVKETIKCYTAYICLHNDAVPQPKHMPHAAYIWLLTVSHILKFIAVHVLRITKSLDFDEIHTTQECAHTCITIKWTHTGALRKQTYLYTSEETPNNITNNEKKTHTRIHWRREIWRRHIEANDYEQRYQIVKRSIEHCDYDWVVLPP